LIEAKDESIRVRQSFEETRNQRQELDKQKRKLEFKEVELDRRLNHLNQKESELKKNEQSLKDKGEHLSKKSEDLDRIIMDQNDRLVKISGMSHDEALKELKANLLSKAKQEAAQMVKEIKDQAVREQEAEIIVSAIQRATADHSTDHRFGGSSAGDGMKGRIIGRKGGTSGHSKATGSI
jgi:ribonuclease Y